MVGRISLLKGQELLAQAAEELRPYADVWVVGKGDDCAALAARCKWRHVTDYQPETLGRELAAIAPHAAVLASVVPETFSYTLSELLNLGVVPLATNLGSFAERIRHGDNGFLFEPDPHHLVALIRTLHAEPQRLPEVAARLAQRAPEPTTGTMASAYRAWLPAVGRPVGRYAVGVGRQTGLSEPYRHLSMAYADLNASYAQVDAAWRQTNEALGESQDALRQLQEALRQTQDSLDQTQQAHAQAIEALQAEHAQARQLHEAADARLADIRAEWIQWTAGLAQLRLTRRPWLLRRALAIFRAGRARLDELIYHRGGHR